MFLPCSVNKYDHVADNEAMLNPGFLYFSKDPISKCLYRLKFEIHMFHKVTVHILYLSSTLCFINTFHLVLKASTLEVEPMWLDLLDSYYIRSAMIFAASMIPILLVSFGLLYVYYNYCHPWVSEGVSVGFEPQDNGLWEPSLQRQSPGKCLHNIFTFQAFFNFSTD